MAKHLVTATTAAFTLGLMSCNQPEPNSAKEEIHETIAKETPVKRGEYLVTVGGCNDCHSPKIMTQFGPEIDSSRLLSGRPENDKLPAFDLKHLQPGNGVYFTDDLTAMAGPWGVSFPINLTPDTATGIGAWRDEMFIKILRSGKHMGSDAARPILPPMPWQNFAKMTDEDLKAVFAYLKSLPAIKNKAPEALTPQEAIAMRK